MNSNCEYLYVIINKKQLEFYRMTDFRKIANFPLYSTPRCVICSEEYICMAMSDKKIISFLICDPSKKIPKEKIQKLKSREIANPGTEKHNFQTDLFLKSGTLFNSNPVSTKDKFIGVFELNSDTSNDNNNSTIKTTKKTDTTNYDDIRKKIVKSNGMNILKECLVKELTDTNDWEIDLLVKSKYHFSKKSFILN